MHEQKSYLALIPARGGSKGLPGKNVKVLGDKPLIAWSIQAAKQSRYIDDVLVSTDDEQIAQVAKQYGADVPFMRPATIASDSAKMMDVIDHAYRFLAQAGKTYDFLVLLQPTSPFRHAKHIDEAIELRHQRHADVILGMIEAEHSPLLYNKLPVDGNMNNFYSTHLQHLNRQDMEKYYRLNGAIYVARFDELLASQRWIGEKTYAYIMERRHSVDIDHLEDFLFAQMLFNEGLHQ